MGLGPTALRHVGRRPGFWFWAAAIALLAWAIREYFVIAAIVDIPIRGDTREYVLYAWNLYHHGVFSLTEPGVTPIVPDAFRSPGYPWLLACCMRLWQQGWYGAVLQTQVLAGTATVWLTMLVGRRWLAPGWALASGALLALWPHHIAATGALLSEVVFGLGLMAGLWAYGRADDKPAPITLSVAALVFGAAYLVNPVVALFPPVLALLLWRRRGGRASLVFLGLFLLPVLAWNLRGLTLPSVDAGARPGRAAINFVQGSWPEYHWAWQLQRFGDTSSIATMRTIEDETGLLARDPVAGLNVVAARLAQRPGHYARWYLWEKPSLLWDWEVRIGPGDVYVLVVRHSPLRTHPLLHGTSVLLEHANPLLTLLAFLGAGGLLWAALRRRRGEFTGAGTATATLFLYLTLVHVVFQAEPRYSTAYRGIELLLIVTSLQWMAEKMPAWIRRRSS